MHSFCKFNDYKRRIWQKYVYSRFIISKLFALFYKMFVNVNIVILVYIIYFARLLMLLQGQPFDIMGKWYRRFLGGLTSFSSVALHAFYTFIHNCFLHFVFQIIHFRPVSCKVIYSYLLQARLLIFKIYLPLPPTHLQQKNMQGLSWNTKDIEW